MRKTGIHCITLTCAVQAVLALGWSAPGNSLWAQTPGEVEVREWPGELAPPDFWEQADPPRSLAEVRRWPSEVPPGELWDDRTQPRSLADVRDRPNEVPPRFLWPDRDMAQRPQVRCGPFVALTSTPQMELQQLATQVEEANQAYVRISSLWNDQANFDLNRLDSLAVLAHDVTDLRDAPPPGVYTDFDGTLHLVLPADGRESPALTHELRTKIILHVLNASGQAARLTQDTTEDLASFMATYGGPPSETAYDLFASPSEAIVARGPRGEIETAIALNYMWQGDDAAMAPRLAAAMRAATVRGNAQPLETLLHEAANQAARNEWLADPLAGQPQLEYAEGISPELALRQREMTLLLKLASRFPADPPHEITPSITSFVDGDEGTTDLAETPPPRSFDDFCRQVLASEDWATLDIDGTVLFAADRDRLMQLFALTEGRYQFVHREGREVLLCNWQQGEMLTGYLAEDEENPSRPLATFEFEPAE